MDQFWHNYDCFAGKWLVILELPEEKSEALLDEKPDGYGMNTNKEENT